MAAKVNTKFVMMLAGALVLVFAGTAGTYMWLKNKSGDDNERKGDRFMAAGNYKDAESAYAKAVNKQPTNPVRLTKWRDSLVHLVPDVQTVYEQKFMNEYMKATRTLALAKRDDVAAHRQWLQLRDDLISSQRFDSQVNTDFITEVDSALGNFDPKRPGPEQVLRRYSGRALVRIMAAAPSVTDAQVKRAKEDLEAAIKADPTDVDSQMAMVAYYGALTARANKDKQPEQEQAMRAQAEQAMNDVIAKFPDNPRLIVAGVRAKTEKLLRDNGLSADLSPEERREKSLAIEDKVRAMSTDLDAAAAKLAEAKELEADTLTDFSTMEAGIDPKAAWSRTQKIARAQLEKRPDDAMIRNLLASSLGQTGKVDEALAEYQKIIELPRKPLSIDGLRLFNVQNAAAIAQADLAMQDYFTEDDAGKKTAAMERAKQYRAKVTQRGIKDEVPSVIFFDAKMKVAQEDWPSANKLMVKFFTALGSDRYADAQLIHAQILLNLNQPGAAIAAAEKLRAMEPNNTTAYKIYARALYAMEDKDKALEIMTSVVSDNPNDAEAAQILARWQQAKDPSSITDPVARELAQIDQAPTSGVAQVDQVELYRTMAEKYQQDPRVVARLAQALVEKQDKPAAADAIKKGLAAHPDNEDLKRLDRALAAEDTVGALVALVDESTLSGEDKVIRKYAILRGYKRNDEAAQILKTAFAKYPTDARLLELMFLEAIDRKDVDGANALADTAAKLDADAAEGLTFRARVFILQDRLGEAAATLRSATNKRSVSPEAWRLLARVQARLTRTQDAIRAYEEALKLRPNDRETLREYVAYLSDFDATRALQIARENERFAQGDAGFQDLWLRLEGRVGDKNRAIQERLKLAEKEPENVNNLGAVATLYLDLKDYKTARTFIDKVEALKPSLAVTLLDARWHTEQRAAEQAKKLMEDYIAKQDQAKLTIEPFIAFGQFMVQRGQADEGLAMMERGRPYQDAKRAEIDRTIGDTLAGLGRDDAASQAYERVLAAGGDDKSNLVRLRLAEMYLRQRKCKEADALLEKIGAGTQKEDATAMLLAADSADCVGDSKRAHDVLDRAVATFPDEPMVYVKRAEFLLKDAASRRDAMADLDAALRIRPGYARALQIRSGVFMTNNDLDKGIADLQTLVKANPQLTDVRDNLIRDLLARDRRDQAVQIADEAIAARPGDLQVMARMSDLFRIAEMWPDGARYALMAWAVSKEYDYGIRCLEALLNDPKGDPAQAEGILRTFQGDIAQKPALLLSRAKLQARRSGGNLARSQKQINDDLSAAMDLIPPERLDQLLAWRKDVRRIYVKPADAIAYLGEAAQKVLHRDWAQYFRGDILVSEGAFDQGIKELTALSQSASDETVKVLALRLIGTSWLVHKDPQKAADAWQVGLKAYPEDWEMNNNLAYVLVRYLEKAQDALPHAETAVKSSPDSADALDTLGWVYLKLGKLDEAKKMFEASIGKAGATYSRVPAMIHTGYYSAAKNDFATAKKVVKDVESLLATMDKSRTAEYQADLDELKKQIEGK